MRKPSKVLSVVLYVVVAVAVVDVSVIVRSVTGARRGAGSRLFLQCA